MNNLPKTEEDLKIYWNSLEEGERVIETGVSGMYGRTGVVYMDDKRETSPNKCVRWDTLDGEVGYMGTSITWGTRRLTDIKSDAMESFKEGYVEIMKTCLNQFPVEIHNELVATMAIWGKSYGINRGDYIRKYSRMLTADEADAEIEKIHREMDEELAADAANRFV